MEIKQSIGDLLRYGGRKKVKTNKIRIPFPPSWKKDKTMKWNPVESKRVDDDAIKLLYKKWVFERARALTLKHYFENNKMLKVIFLLKSKNGLWTRKIEKKILGRRYCNKKWWVGRVTLNTHIFFLA